MTNVQRKRWDFSANPSGHLDFAVDLATEIEVGDLCWLDVDDAKPASATTLWTGTEAGTLARFAEKFIGVAASAHRANDALVTTVRVHTRGTFSHPLDAATTLEIGNLIGGKKDTGGNYLYAQKVAKVTEPTYAIGKVQKRGTSLTLAHYEIAGASAAGGGNRQFLTS